MKIDTLYPMVWVGIVLKYVPTFYFYSKHGNRSGFEPKPPIRNKKISLNCFFFFLKKKWTIPGLFLFIFVFSIQLIINKCSIKFCRWLESNRGPLVTKSTALPTEPQPLPIIKLLQAIIITQRLAYLVTGSNSWIKLQPTRWRHNWLVN